MIYHRYNYRIIDIWNVMIHVHNRISTPNYQWHLFAHTGPRERRCTHAHTTRRGLQGLGYIKVITVSGASPPSAATPPPPWLTGVGAAMVQGRRDSAGQSPQFVKSELHKKEAGKMQVKNWQCVFERIRKIRKHGRLFLT